MKNLIITLLLISISTSLYASGPWVTLYNYGSANAASSMALCTTGTYTYNGSTSKNSSCDKRATELQPQYSCTECGHKCEVVSGSVLCRASLDACDAPKTWNASTGTCDDPMEVCSAPLVLDSVTGQCVPGPGACIGQQVLDVSVTPNVCRDPVCNANETIGADKICTPCLPPNAVVNNECSNPQNCSQYQQFDPATNSCKQGDCSSSATVGDVYDSFGNCACANGSVNVRNGLSDAGTCTQKKACNPSSPNYQGDINGVSVCDISKDYGSNGAQCGLVGNEVVCMGANPCSYESLLAGGCSSDLPKTDPKDVDGDGDLDGGNEGMIPDGTTVAPPALPPNSSSGHGSGISGGFGINTGTTITTNSDGTTSTSQTTETVDYSAITSRQDQQTAQLTKMVGNGMLTNEKIDTTNNLLKKISDAYDTSSIPTTNFSENASDKVDLSFDGLTSSLPEHDASFIGSPSDIGSPDSVFNFLGNQSADSCQNLYVTIPHTSFNYHFDCDKIEPFRDMFEWALYVMTLFYIFEIGLNARSKD